MHINQVHHPIAARFPSSHVCVRGGGGHARLLWSSSKWLVTDALGTRVHVRVFVQTLCCKEDW